MGVPHPQFFLPTLEGKKEKKNERLSASNLTPHGYVVDTLISPISKDIML